MSLIQMFKGCFHLILTISLSDADLIRLFNLKLELCFILEYINAYMLS